MLKKSVSKKGRFKTALLGASLLLISSVSSAGMVFGIQDGVEFDGSSFVQSEVSPSYNLNDEITLALKFTVDETVDEWVRLVGLGNSVERNYGMFIKGSTGNVVFQVRAQDDNTYFGSTTTMFFTLGQEYSLVGNYNRLEKTSNLWLDGALINTNTTSKADMTLHQPDSPITVGGASFHDNFIGEINNVGVFDTALVQADVDTFESSGIATFITGSSTVQGLSNAAVSDVSNLPFAIMGALGLFLLCSQRKRSY
jgi:hypothetical protein